MRYSYSTSQEWLNPNVRGMRMRVIFNIEIKAEIDSLDTRQKKVFIRLMSDAAKSLYCKSVLLSNKISPKISATVEDTQHGRVAIDLFAEQGGDKK